MEKSEPSRAPIPRGVKIFVVVHLVAIAVISIAAGIVGVAFEEQTATNARYMRLVPVSVVSVSVQDTKSPGP